LTNKLEQENDSNLKWVRERIISQNNISTQISSDIQEVKTNIESFTNEFTAEMQTLEED